MSHNAAGFSFALPRPHHLPLSCIFVCAERYCLFKPPRSKVYFEKGNIFDWFDVFRCKGYFKKPFPNVEE